MVIVDTNKYEDYIRVGHTLDPNNPGNAIDGYNCIDLWYFPTPSALGRTLHDVDVDAYTDLEGFTQRNRVRHDVEDITLTYNTLSDKDEAFILDAIWDEYIYVELTDKHFLDNVYDENNYCKCTKDGDIYWHDTEANKMYTSSYEEVQNWEWSDGYEYVYTSGRKVYKMYASDKQWDTFAVVKDENGWHTQDIEFSFSLVEQ